MPQLRPIIVIPSATKTASNGAVPGQLRLERSAQRSRVRPCTHHHVRVDRQPNEPRPVLAIVVDDGPSRGLGRRTVGVGETLPRYPMLIEISSMPTWPRCATPGPDGDPQMSVLRFLADGDTIQISDGSLDDGSAGRGASGYHAQADEGPGLGVAGRRREGELR